jgi:hypothetical protein
VPEIDSITALGRLLRDGSLRDAYAAQPSQTVDTMCVTQTQRAALLDLKAEDLEFQAQVLLRKRYQTVSALIPLTCSSFGESAWACFMEYARDHWPAGNQIEVLDARDFVQHLRQKHGASVAHSETNRIRFALGMKRISFHFLKRIRLRNRERRAVQVFLRLASGRWNEYLFYFSF